MEFSGYRMAKHQARGKRGSGNKWHGYCNYSLTTKDRAVVVGRLESGADMSVTIAELLAQGLNLSIKQKQDGESQHYMVTVMRADSEADDAGIALTQRSSYVDRAVVACHYVYFDILGGELVLDVEDDW